MKLTRLFTLAALLATSLSARAEVVIYKGLIRSHVDLAIANTLPKAYDQYLVVDFDANQMGTVFFYPINGQKLCGEGSPGDVHVLQSPLPKGKTATVLSTCDKGAANSAHPDNYNEIMTLISGTNTSVTLSTSPKLSENHPRTLSLITVGAAQFDFGANYEIQKGVMAVDSAQTIKANNAKQTMQEVLDSLLAQLKAAGYKTP